MHLDIHKQDRIEYVDFMIASMDFQEYFEWTGFDKDAVILSIFNHFDLDLDG
jgi:hypothetical protein